MTAALINYLHGFDQSTNSYYPPKHNILKQKLSGQYVEYKGCPKESTVLIYPHKSIHIQQECKDK